MTTLFNHERLNVYQDAIRFVSWSETLLGEIQGQSIIKDQMSRAGISIPLNIAEGNGKRKPLDRARYFDIARGSAMEAAACLDVLRAKGLIDDARVMEGKKALLAIVSMLHGLIERQGISVGEEEAEYRAASRNEKLGRPFLDQDQDYDHDQEVGLNGTSSDGRQG